MVDLSKFTSNKKILNKVVVLDYNQVCNQTLSYPFQVKFFNLYLIFK